MSDTQQDFINQYGPVANQIASQTGLDPSVILGHIAQETGWGSHVAGGGTNPFGISGPDGNPAQYSSINDAANAYTNLMKSQRYAGISQGAPNQQPYLIAASGYGPSSQVAANSGTAGGQAYGDAISHNAEVIRNKGFSGSLSDDDLLKQMVPQQQQQSTTPAPPTISDDDLLKKMVITNSNPAATPGVATPDTLEYLSGKAQQGIGQFVSSLPFVNAHYPAKLAAAMDQANNLPPGTTNTPVHTPTNQEVFGQPNVQPPSTPAKYIGAVVQGATSNPVIATLAPAATIGASLGAQAGSDAFPNSKIAPIVGGLLGGGLGAVGGNALSAGVSRMNTVATPAGPIAPIMDHPTIPNQPLTAAMQAGASPEVIAQEAALRSKFPGRFTGIDGQVEASNLAHLQNTLDPLLSNAVKSKLFDPANPAQNLLKSDGTIDPTKYNNWLNQVLSPTNKRGANIFGSSDIQTLEDIKDSVNAKQVLDAATATANPKSLNNLGASMTQRLIAKGGPGSASPADGSNMAAELGGAAAEYALRYALGMPGNIPVVGPALGYGANIARNAFGAKYTGANKAAVSNLLTQTLSKPAPPPQTYNTGALLPNP